MKLYFPSACIAALLACPCFAGVSVSAPANNSNVATSVQFVATAASNCGVAAMGIYTAPNVLAYTTKGASLNAELTLNPGTYNTVIEEWDNCGGASTATVKINVGGGGGRWRRRENIRQPASTGWMDGICTRAPVLCHL